MTKRWLRTVAGLLLAAGLGAAATAPRVTLLFQATFDQGVTPEVGAFLPTQSTSVIQLVPAPGGGDQLRIDGSGSSGSGFELFAGFADGIVVDQGTFLFDWTTTFGQATSVFLTGIIVDSPNGDFVPASGSDGSGYLQLGGKKSDVPVLVGTPLHFQLQLTRDTPHQNWTYAISITPWGSSGGNESPVAAMGVLGGTADAGIQGIGFVEPAGSAGIYDLDDIQAQWIDS